MSKLWALGAVVLIAWGGRVWAQTAALPPGIQESPTLTAEQQDRLREFINAQLETLRNGPTFKARQSARDNLLQMFDHRSVSTAFRSAAGSALRNPIEEMIASSDLFLRFSGFRLAARTSSDELARLFEGPIAAGTKPQRLFALGQLKELFIEVDRGGLAVQPATLEGLSGTIGRLLAEEEDATIALFEVRALQQLSAATRPELEAASKKAMSDLARGVSDRLGGIPSRPFGETEDDRIELLLQMEALDAARAILVASNQIDTSLANDLGTWSGQVLAFVLRVYEKVPPRAGDDARRHLERLTLHALETAQQVVLRMPGNPNPPITQKPEELVKRLGTDMNRFKIEILRLIGPDGEFYRLFKVKPGSFALE
ncbi:MAG: hypothetical protein Kow0022_07790 [Phycisphaerales bacterium]